MEHAAQERNEMPRTPIVRRSRKKGWLIAGVALVCIAAMGVTLFMLNEDNTGTRFPEKILSQAKFPLYYPTSLPEGYELDQDTIGISDKALIFSISYKGGEKKLVISEQPKPITLNLDEFYAKRFISPETSFSGGNRIVVGSLASVKTASVVYGDTTWILIKAPDGIEQAILAKIAGSFQKAD